jgi:hypothetical protein
VILLCIGYTKERLHLGGIGQGKETTNFNVVDMLTVWEQIVIKLAEATMGRGLWSSEEDW